MWRNGFGKGWGDCWSFDFWRTVEDAFTGFSGTSTDVPVFGRGRRCNGNFGGKVLWRKWVIPAVLNQSLASLPAAPPTHARPN
ncbi:hypothetical protein SAMN05444359_11425 [Neolewinella agarilytica]|uniref:Uncharacterized protein n=1 Tax=Neolewinella agarilytica TaxID=478744 RepID=A0A1H9I3L4_9BACT|nr:hypothetical protein SAMN05444359_11425 [Neolewinella agarilytica]